jgi:hypothetical protein
MKRVTATSGVLAFVLLTSHVTAQATQNNQPQDPQALAEWHRNHDLALKYKTAWDLYMARTMGRNAPKQSDKMEVVEIWEKTSPTRISVDVWLYDPAVYAEPWYVQRGYNQVPNQDKSLRIRYWDCNENPNNAVVKTPDGSTQYTDFTFEDKKK